LLCDKIQQVCAFASDPNYFVRLNMQPSNNTIISRIRKQKIVIDL